MIEIVKELKIEVSKPNIFQAIVAKQYDMNTRFLKVTLVDCGTEITVSQSDSKAVVINAERPDGKSKGFDGTVNDDGTVTVPLHSWMLELDGAVICDISVIDFAESDNKKLTTTSFTLLVEKAAYGGDTITKDPQYDVLVQLLETCSAASEVAEDALQKSNEANSKYDACVEATEKANNAADTANTIRAEIEAGGYIESLKELNNGEKFTFWVGTEEEYKALPEIIQNCFYLTTDGKPPEDIMAEVERILSEVIPPIETEVENVKITANQNAESISNLENLKVSVAHATDMDLIEWCEANAREGLQVVQIHDSTTGAPVRYTLGLYFCNEYLTRRMIIIPADGVMFTNLYQAPDGIGWLGWQKYRRYDEPISGKVDLVNKDYNDSCGTLHYSVSNGWVNIYAEIAYTRFVDAIETKAILPQSIRPSSGHRNIMTYYNNTTGLMLRSDGTVRVFKVPATANESFGSGYISGSYPLNI